MSWRFRHTARPFAGLFASPDGCWVKACLACRPELDLVRCSIVAERAR